MNPESLFTLCNTTALICWIILILFPYKKFTSKLLFGVVVMAFCVLYSSLLLSSAGSINFEDFNSLDGVMAMFGDPKAVLVGWIHYLAFDLLTGLYIVHDAQKHDIKGYWLLPCLFFTFMTGPFGLLTYLILRGVKSRKYPLIY